MTSGVEASIVVKPSYGLTDEEIVRMLQEGNSSAEADMQARKLREEQVEAKRLLESTASALTQDGDLLSPEEQAEIDRLARAVGSAINGTDADVIHKAVEALSKGTEALLNAGWTAPSAQHWPAAASMTLCLMKSPPVPDISH